MTDLGSFKRTLAALVTLGIVVACHPNSQAPLPVDSLKTIEVSVPVTMQGAWLGTLEQYATDRGFAFESRSESSSNLGQLTMFELRRNDFWIIGRSQLNNVPDDVPVVNGEFQLGEAYHPSLFDISFYPGQQAASSAYHEQQIMEFEAALQDMAGVEIHTLSSPETESFER